LGAFSRVYVENQQKDKHVEGTFVTCLDAGSNPAGSTETLKYYSCFFLNAAVFCYE